jgi:hypothetical protein
MEKGLEEIMFKEAVDLAKSIFYKDTIREVFPWYIFVGDSKEKKVFLEFSSTENEEIYLKGIQTNDSDYSLRVKDFLESFERYRREKILLILRLLSLFQFRLVPLQILFSRVFCLLLQLLLLLREV